MYSQFYGFREDPFGVTPDPRLLYATRMHREALASLIYGIETGRGFVALIGEPGMGKTTLLFELLQRFKSSAETAFLFQTQCDSLDFMRFLLHEVGLEADDRDLPKIYQRFNGALLRQVRTGKRFIIVVDEAQNLSDKVLETVRLLSDFETSRSKLLQIVLSGQPELARKLARPELLQLRQRIAITARLNAMSAAEVGGYIAHRIQAVGYGGPDLFTPAALERIAECSGGVPRLVNHICFNALSLGFAADTRVIDDTIVAEAARDLEIGNVCAESDLHPVLFEDKPGPAPRATVQPTRSRPVPAVQAPGSGSRGGWAVVPTNPAPRVAAAPLQQHVAEQSRPASERNSIADAASIFELVPASTPPTTGPKSTLDLGSSAQARRQVQRAFSNAEEPQQARGTAAHAIPKFGPAAAASNRWVAIPVVITLCLALVGLYMSRPESMALVGVAIANAVTEIGDGAAPPAMKLVSHRLPEYPKAARRSRVEGLVVLNALVDEAGHVIRVEAIKGDPLLAEAARSAVSQWRYAPPLRNGKPTSQETTVRLNFRLAGGVVEKY